MKLIILTTFATLLFVGAGNAQQCANYYRVFAGDSCDSIASGN